MKPSKIRSEAISLKIYQFQTLKTPTVMKFKMLETYKTHNKTIVFIKPHEQVELESTKWALKKHVQCFNTTTSTETRNDGNKNMCSNNTISLDTLEP